MNFKIIIAGSRTFTDYPLMHQCVKDFMAILKPVQNGRKVTIVSGGAKGADELGERLASQYQSAVDLLVMKANWDRDGRGAGYARNERMSEIANACIVFCVDQSRGSTHMRNIAMQKNIPVAFVEIEKGVLEHITYTGVAA